MMSSHQTQIEKIVNLAKVWINLGADKGDTLRELSAHLHQLIKHGSITEFHLFAARRVLRSRNILRGTETI